MSTALRGRERDPSRFFPWAAVPTLDRLDAAIREGAGSEAISRYTQLRDCGVLLPAWDDAADDLRRQFCADTLAHLQVTRAVLRRCPNIGADRLNATVDQIADELAELGADDALRVTLLDHYAFDGSRPAELLAQLQGDDFDVHADALDDECWDHRICGNEGRSRRALNARQRS